MSLVTISELVKGAEQLETPALEDYIQKILQIRAKRVSTNLEKQEATLLKKINLGLTSEQQEKKAILWKKKSCRNTYRARTSRIDGNYK